MTNAYNVVVLLLTENCLEKIDKTIEILHRQTFNPLRLKIVAVDNGSTDGTYERLIKHSLESNLSVYRLKEKDLPTRLLRLALKFIEYVDYKYITLLRPGDILYPEYIAKCAEVMDKYADIERRVLISEADIFDDSGTLVHQIPIFSNNCILHKRIHYTYLLAIGSQHKIQSFYCKKTIPNNLPDLPFCIDHTDWFKMAFYAFFGECIYLKDSLSLIHATPYEDPFYELMLRLYQITRLEITKNTLFSDMPLDDNKNVPSMEFVKTSLCRLALKLAAHALDKSDAKTAKKIMLFAEMVDENILNLDEYHLLDQFLKNGTPFERERFCSPREETISPPTGVLII